MTYPSPSESRPGHSDGGLEKLLSFSRFLFSSREKHIIQYEPVAG